MFFEPPLAGRLRAGVVAVLAALTLGAWLFTARLVGPGMGGDAGEGMAATGTRISLLAAMWMVMMAAMMLPSTAPVVSAVARIAHTRRARSEPATAPWVFGLGYLLVWLAVGLLYAAAELALRMAMMESPALAGAGPVAGGAVLVVAGLYQLSPLKDLCLRHCRSPLGFILTHWRDGPAGAVVLGARHGLYCLGCCWALMATLFATAPLGLVWPLALSLLVFVEKDLPFGRRVATVAGLALIALGLARATGLFGGPASM